MACSRYEYVKTFESETILLPNTFIVVRLDGRGFSRFTKEHGFEKANDIRGISLMNHCAAEVMREWGDVVLAYGESDEYSFVFPRRTTVFGRRSAKIATGMCSLFAAAYVMHWPRYFRGQPLRRIPAFDARCVAYPTLTNLMDYLKWRQVDTHINVLHNEVFWALVKLGGKTTDAAHLIVKDTVSEQKHEILFSQFGINYAKLPVIFRRGTVLGRTKELVRMPLPLLGLARPVVAAAACAQTEVNTPVDGGPQVVCAQAAAGLPSSNTTAAAPAAAAAATATPAHKDVASASSSTSAALPRSTFHDPTAPLMAPRPGSSSGPAPPFAAPLHRSQSHHPASGDDASSTHSLSNNGTAAHGPAAPAAAAMHSRARSGSSSNSLASAVDGSAASLVAVSWHSVPAQASGSPLDGAPPHHPHSLFDDSAVGEAAPRPLPRGAGATGAGKRPSGPLFAGTAAATPSHALLSDAGALTTGARTTPDAGDGSAEPAAVPSSKRAPRGDCEALQAASAAHFGRGLDSAQWGTSTVFSGDAVPAIDLSGCSVAIVFPDFLRGSFLVDLFALLGEEG